MSTTTDDHRQRVYELLAAAAPAAVKVVDIWKAGLTNVHAHIESLRFEGHAITQVQIGERKEWGWRLDRDAWAKPAAAAGNVLDDVVVRERHPKGEVALV